jgi:hypothetical protein
MSNSTWGTATRTLGYLGIELVRQRLKVNGGGRDLLSAGGVVAVREMATGGQVKPHDTVMRVQQGSVHREVGRAANAKEHSDYQNTSTVVDD